MFVDVVITELKIYPPERYAAWWWFVLAACVAAIVLILVWAIVSWRRLSASPDGHDALDVLRQESLQRIAKIESAHQTGQITTATAFQRLGVEVRRFAGIATNGDADYLVLPELRRVAVKDSRLEPVVAIVEQIEGPAFAPASAEANQPAPWGETLRQARQVIEQWV